MPPEIVPMLSNSELTYLELCAKHAPHELPASSELVLRLLNELAAARASEDEYEEQGAELRNELSATEDWHKEDGPSARTGRSGCDGTGR